MTREEKQYLARINDELGMGRVYWFVNDLIEKKDKLEEDNLYLRKIIHFSS
jgi:hypothetical protein